MTTTELIVCTSCGYSDRDDEGRTRGERLQRELLRRLEHREGAVAVRGTACFMACGRGCNVHLRAAGKMGYIIGDLDPASPSSVDTLLDYVAHYSNSDGGVVPYANWPEGIGKKFVCRIPPSDST